MQKHEAKLTAKLRKYLQESGLHLGSSGIEVKVSTSNRIRFDAVKPHQIQALQNARGIMVWKIADDSRGVKPFDLFVLQNANAFVALSWIKPREKTIVYLLPVLGWERLRVSSKQKSLTECALLESGERVMKLVLPTNPSSQPLS